MEKCYEFLDCNEMDCIRRETDNLQCWEIEGTLCYDHSDIFTKFHALLENKVDACVKCNYYKIYNNKTTVQS